MAAAVSEKEGSFCLQPFLKLSFFQMHLLVGLEIPEPEHLFISVNDNTFYHTRQQKGAPQGACFHLPIDGYASYSKISPSVNDLAIFKRGLADETDNPAAFFMAFISHIRLLPALKLVRRDSNYGRRARISFDRIPDGVPIQGRVPESTPEMFRPSATPIAGGLIVYRLHILGLLCLCHKILFADPEQASCIAGRIGLFLHGPEHQLFKCPRSGFGKL